MADKVFIQNIAFGESAVEITFMEARDAGEHVALIKTCVFSVEALEDEVNDLQEVAASLLDDALVILRLGGRKPVLAPEPDDDEIDAEQERVDDAREHFSPGSGRP